MRIDISKESEVPIRDQLAEGIAFLVGTGALKPGELLPSVRSLARQLQVHYNTVSQAYHDLVDRNVLVRRPGSRLAVRPLEGETGTAPRVKDLDDLINAAIRSAQDNGYTLQQLRQRVRERLMAQPPDHVLVVEEEAGLRQILQTEIREHSGVRVESCTTGDLVSNQGLTLGALVVCHEGARRFVEPLISKDCPMLPLWFSAADEHVALVRQLRRPSIIAVASVSRQFLRTARGVLATAAGKSHTLQPHLWPDERLSGLRAADVVFCDSVTRHKIKAGKVFCYHLIEPGSLERLSARFHAR